MPNLLCHPRFRGDDKVGRGAGHVPGSLPGFAKAQPLALVSAVTGKEAGLDRKQTPDVETLPPLSEDARAIVENMGDAYYALDGAWRIVYANRRALEFWRLDARDVIGRVIWECLPQLVGTYNETVLRRVRAERRPISFEAPSPVTKVWVQANVAPTADGVSVYWRDITERVRGEQTLRASEEHLRLAQEAAGIGTWEWDLATGHMHWSPQMFRLIGRDPAQIADADHYTLWRRALHPDDRNALAAAVRAASRSVGSFALEFRVLRADGELRWIDARGNVLADASGKPRRMLGVNIDITERKQAEAALEQRVTERTRALRETVEELRRSRERYTAIFAHAPIYLAFLRVEADGRVICEDVNDAWIHDTGFEREQVVGRSLDEIFPPKQAEFGQAQYRRAIETGERVEYEYAHTFPAGDVVRRTFLAPLRDAEGRVDRVLMTSFDLTAMRRVEAQLHQAQKMEAIGQLTGGVAHDFNNLLTVVLGNLELLAGRVQDERSMRHVRAAQRAAQRGGELTQQLLAYARRQTISPRAVDLAAMISGMSDLLQRSLGGLVRVNTTLDADLWPAFCDSTQLELMLLNLAINARDAMPAGGVIVIAAHNVPASRKLPPELDPGDYVSISVIDSGSGMSPEIRDRAFEPFFTTKEPGKGSGLGLAQVWGLAQQFGGSVVLDSVPDRGTTVQVFLPRAEAVAETEATPTGQQDASARSGGVVLIVDDDADAREVAAAFIEQYGYAVLLAGSGQEALACLEQFGISLALVDYAMPGMSGAEFVRRAQELQPGLPIVYVTGNPDALAAEAPADAAPLVIKPYTRAGLANAVHQALHPFQRQAAQTREETQ
jgi:PAS domain S-box-containing protein